MGEKVHPETTKIYISAAGINNKEFVRLNPDVKEGDLVEGGRGLLGGYSYCYGEGKK